MTNTMGHDAHTYISTTDYDSPTWVWIDVVSSNLPYSPTKVDSTTRGSAPFKTSSGGLVEMALSLEIILDLDSAEHLYLQTAAVTRPSPVFEVLMLRGPIDLVGTTGWRMPVWCSKYDEDQPLDDHIKVSAELSVGRLIHNSTLIKPERYTVPTPP